MDVKQRCEKCGSNLEDYGIDFLCPKCPTFMSKDYKPTSEERLGHLDMKLSMLEMRLKEYEKLVEEQKALRSERFKLAKLINERKQTETRERLEKETSFKECQYPAMGVDEREGRATFKDHDQADALIESLRAVGSYYYAYVLHWDGPGEYRVVPEWQYDHDRDVIYTANFVKKIA